LLKNADSLKIVRKKCKIIILIRKVNWRINMAWEIKPTESILNGDAEKFLAQVNEVNENPGTEVLEFPEITIEFDDE
jgi:hypothetical protein